MSNAEGSRVGVREGKSEEAGRDGVVRVVDELYRRALKLRRIDLLNTLCSCDGVLQTEIADVPREAGDSVVIALGVAVDWNEVSTVESSAESAKTCNFFLFRGEDCVGAGVASAGLTTSTTAAAASLTESSDHKSNSSVLRLDLRRIGGPGFGPLLTKKRLVAVSIPDVPFMAAAIPESEHRRCRLGEAR